MDKKIVAIDLDGTFVSVNTFHKWIKFLFVESLKSFKLIALVKILKITSLRYLNIIDHSQMKFSILKISETSIGKKQRTSFVQSLVPYVNKEILEVIQSKDNITILATAAPLFYSKVIKEKYYFDYVIATGNTNNDNWKENIREEKQKNLIALLNHYSLTEKIDDLYTDHHDDLPLMKLSKFIYLVNPSEITQKIVKNSNILFKILR